MKDLVKLAQSIATKAHEGQTRWDKKTPYITHPAAVAKACKDLSQNEYAQAVAWLHDVVEDTDYDVHDLLEAGIPGLVVSAVDAITKRDGESYLSYILRVRDNELARLVKIQDIKHNMSCWPQHKKKNSMWQKYELAVYILERKL